MTAERIVHCVGRNAMSIPTTRRSLAVLRRIVTAGLVAGAALSAGNSVARAAATCPCSLWDPVRSVPAVTDEDDGSSVEVGVNFRTDTTGFIYGIRFYKGVTNTGPHVAHLWSSSGVLLASATFTGETPSGWQQVLFPDGVFVAGNTIYVASYNTGAGHYSATEGYFASAGVDAAPLHAPGGGLNGVYAYGTGTFPSFSYNSTNYWVDVLFGTALGEGGPPVPPVVTAVSPAPDATGINVGSAVRVTFSKTILASSISASTIELRDSANTPLAGTVTYDAASRTALFAPSSPLLPSASYAIVALGGTSGAHVTDTIGVPMTATFTTRFTTAAAPGACPCTIWPSSAVPAVADSDDSNAVELGVRFRADADGFITGVRFYKSAANTGLHEAHLWTSAGALLATATFTAETPSGWQQATFDAPVPIAANAQYIASYHTDTGRYSVDDAYFTAGGVDAYPLHALPDGSGGNGVYRYGPSGFPDGSYEGSNYWVDVVFATGLGTDSKPPSVVTTNPAGGATGVGVSSAVQAVFSEPLDPASVTGSTFELRAPGNIAVPATVSYDAASSTATLTPAAPLTASAVYTARLHGGGTDPEIKDLAGNALSADAVWSFTVSPPLACPCTIWPSNTTPAMVDSGDLNPVEVGVKFRSDGDGFITGLRFYKSAGNTGLHVANLWTGSGTLLATATFVSETSSGWQQVTFPAPVAVSANTLYVASYYTSQGRYSVTPAYFAAAGADASPLHAPSSAAAAGNGVYRYGPTAFPFSSFNGNNYWVDVVFNPIAGGDTTPPSVLSTSPAAGAAGVNPASMVRAVFSEAMDPTSVTAGTFELRDGANALVTAAVGYDASTGTATLTPAAALAPFASYTARLAGGPGPALTDRAGNALPADVVWAFTTGALPSVFIDTTVADFSRGALDTAGTITANGDGELALSPLVNGDFNGTALPSGWTSSPWVGLPSLTFALGEMRVDGTFVASSSLFHFPAASLEFAATFSGAPYQHAGFGVSLTDTTWALFSSGAGDGLYARSNDGNTSHDTLIPGSWFGTPHRFRIDWTATTMTYFVDGTQVASHPVSIGGMLRPLASDYVGDGSVLKIDWMRMTPYGAGSTFLSGVLDAGAPVTWSTASWSGTSPAGTTVTMSVRYGNSPTPDATWTPFTAVSGPFNGVARYLQYRLQLATSDTTKTPIVTDVTVTAVR
jgi:hypothetical protein